MTLTNEAIGTAADERATAIALSNETWKLCQNAGRTPDETDRLIHMAHAARFHWDNCGTNQDRARGEWQVSRIYASLGRNEPALFHARRAVDYATRYGVADWVPASAYEGLARAYLSAGDVRHACEARDKALALVNEIGRDEDKAIVLGDIQSLPLPAKAPDGLTR